MKLSQETMWPKLMSGSIIQKGRNNMWNKYNVSLETDNQIDFYGIITF